MANILIVFKDESVGRFQVPANNVEITPAFIRADGRTLAIAELTQKSGAAPSWFWRIQSTVLFSDPDNPVAFGRVEVYRLMPSSNELSEALDKFNGPPNRSR